MFQLTSVCIFCIQQESNVIMVGVYGFTSLRNRLIDYPYPTGITSMALLIPKPTSEENNYFVAIWQPFQTPVWLDIMYNFVDFQFILITLLTFRCGLL